MILDNIKNAGLYYCLNKRFQKAFEFLINSDLKNFDDGKYVIDSENIFANVQTLELKPKKELKWEAHRKYIDIQFIIKNNELMGVYDTNEFKKIKEDYDETKDLIFYENENNSDGSKKNYNFITLKENDFVIFYPQDVHAPMLRIENDKKETVKKVIVKIKI